VANDFDIVAAAGAANTAYIIETQRVVTGSSLTIELVGVKQNPTINAIEVTYVGEASPVAPVAPFAPVAAPPATPPAFKPILLNAGGGSYTDTLGRVWTSDTPYLVVNGNVYTSTSQPIEGTIEDALFQSERWGEMAYEIPIGVGEYEVRLYFAEIVS